MPGKIFLQVQLLYLLRKTPGKAGGGQSITFLMVVQMVKRHLPGGLCRPFRTVTPRV